MEFVAWSTHKYIMHGSLWNIHRDHHIINKNSFFQKNDLFFIIFATPSILLYIFQPIFFSINGLYIAIGISLYGFVYLIVHEIVIHKRLKLIKQDTINKYSYLKAIVDTHKQHHQRNQKNGCVNFGMLIPNKKRK